MWVNGDFYWFYPVDILVRLNSVVRDDILSILRKNISTEYKMRQMRRIKKNQSKVSLLLVVGIFLLSTVSVQAATGMPEFNLQDARNGKSTASKAFAGKALLVTFFATWCSPCLQEIPNLIKLQDEFGKDGFSVLALSVDQGGRDVVQKLISKYSINYPVLMADASTGKAFGGVRAIPSSFLINRDGNLVKKYRMGYIPHGEFENDVKRVLN